MATGQWLLGHETIVMTSKIIFVPSLVADVMMDVMWLQVNVILRLLSIPRWSDSRVWDRQMTCSMCVRQVRNLDLAMYIRCPKCFVWLLYSASVCLQPSRVMANNLIKLRERQLHTISSADSRDLADEKASHTMTHLLPAWPMMIASRECSCRYR